MVEESCDENSAQKIVALQFGLVKETCKYLKTLQSSMMDEGRFTVINKAILLSDEYVFLRESARHAYLSAPPEPVPIQYDDDGSPTGWSAEPFRPLREGGFLAKAYIQSFFSWVEHILILLYPFSCNYEESRVKEFLKNFWKEKWTMVFSSEDINACRALSIMSTLAEIYRNPLAHGAIERNGESFMFHIPGAGAVPFLERRANMTAEALIGQITEKQFQDIVNRQEEVVFLIGKSELALAFEFVMSGLDVSFDGRSRQEYLHAQKSDVDMRELIDYRGWIQDKYANMDF